MYVILANDTLPCVPRFQVLDRRWCFLRRIPRSSPLPHGDQCLHLPRSDERNIQHPGYVWEDQPPVSPQGHCVRLCPPRAKLVVCWFGCHCRDIGFSLSFHDYLLLSRCAHICTPRNYEEGFPRRLAHAHNKKPRRGDDTKQQPGHQRDEHFVPEFLVRDAGTWKPNLVERLDRSVLWDWN